MASLDGLNMIKINFYLFFLFYLFSLSAMKFDIPFMKETERCDEPKKLYLRQLQFGYVQHFFQKFQMHHLQKSPIMKRLMEVTIQKAYENRNPVLYDNFLEFYLQSAPGRERCIILDSVHVGTEVETAYNQVMADLPLLTYVATGSKTEPTYTKERWQTVWNDLRNQAEHKRIESSQQIVIESFESK